MGGSSPALRPVEAPRLCGGTCNDRETTGDTSSASSVILQPPRNPHSKNTPLVVRMILLLLLFHISNLDATQLGLAASVGPHPLLGPLSNLLGSVEQQNSIGPSLPDVYQPSQSLYYQDLEDTSSMEDQYVPSQQYNEPEPYVSFPFHSDVRPTGDFLGEMDYIYGNQDPNDLVYEREEKDLLEADSGLGIVGAPQLFMFMSKWFPKSNQIPSLP